MERADAQTRAMQEQFNLLQQLGADLEQFIDVTDLSGRRRSPSAASAYDALEMDQYNELHTLRPAPGRGGAGRSRDGQEHDGAPR